MARVAVGKVEAAGQPGADGRGRPDQPAHAQHQARPVFVADPAADDLEHGVAVEEGGGDPAVFDVAEAEFLAEGDGGGGDVDAVDIGDAVHQAEQQQHDAGRHVTGFFHRFPLSIRIGLLVSC